MMLGRDLKHIHARPLLLSRKRGYIRMSGHEGLDQLLRFEGSDRREDFPSSLPASSSPPPSLRRHILYSLDCLRNPKTKVVKVTWGSGMKRNSSSRSHIILRIQHHESILRKILLHSMMRWECSSTPFDNSNQISCKARPRRAKGHSTWQTKV